jgi:NADPH:quinone reductase-like Zn-dependent oxidoreductase
VGGTLLTEALRCCRWGAHVLIIGFASGHIPKVAANVLLVKNLTMHGIFWGSYQQHNPRLFRWVCRKGGSCMRLLPSSCLCCLCCLCRLFLLLS